MSWRAASIVLAGLVAVGAAGCGSSAHVTTTSALPPSPVERLETCLQRNGYELTPESPADVATAPRRFEFTAVWNVLNPSRVALALTFSKTTVGAEKAAAWTRQTNTKLARGALSAPVVRFGKIDVLWTSKPGARNMNDVYGCVRREG